jgi:hypothetical protein
VLIRHSHARPIIVVVEDLHWTDAALRRCSSTWSRAWARPT